MIESNDVEPDATAAARTWKYQGISLEIAPRLITGDSSYRVPIHSGEGWGHVLLKIVAAAHLLSWGYPWHTISWEECPQGGPPDCRPDLYATAEGLPEFWIECGVSDSSKLQRIVAARPECRVVHVVDIKAFIRCWNHESVVARVKDPKERKRLILAHRKKFAVAGVEHWAVRETSTTARIIYAVRRERDGGITHLDSGEGWGIWKSLRFVSRRDGFEPLIRGIVGDPSWRGENSYGEALEPRDRSRFAQNLKRAREAAGQTHAALARKAGLAPRAVVKLEQATRGPSTVIVAKLAKALNVSETQLLGQPTLDSTSSTRQP